MWKILAKFIFSIGLVTTAESLKYPTNILGYFLPAATQYLTRSLSLTKTDVLETENLLLNTAHIVPKHIKILHYYNIHGDYKTYDLEESLDIDLDLNQQTVLIVHGHKSKGDINWVKKLAVAYQMKGIGNTLAVDWSRAANKNIIVAFSAIKRVAELITMWLYENIINFKLNAVNQIHLIGHSLGAHICGFIGNNVYNKTGLLLKRITGLDPAGPFFEYPIRMPLYERLDRTDALYVDGYHTCAGFAGFITPFGHQDFYINYGFPIQPGCEKSKLYDSFLCSHARSYQVYTKSIFTDKYVAKKCNSTFSAYLGECDENRFIIMGDMNNGTDIRGNFYVETDNNGNPLIN